ncbi:MAG: glycosyltransferase family 2 protein [Marinoscillum sp.]|uniref:glycosyltransferase family 2 protein n=1 Tax=Marinoscillum sp. TaxID=2024838 RepID=UPI0032F583E2
MGQVSIIMPVKNAAKYLEEAIQSIQNQTSGDWELLVINDHSTDSSDQILQEFKAKDSRIRPYQNTGTGIVPALHQAFGLATGEYVTRMDADDVMPADRIQKMSALLEASEPKTIVTALVRYFSGQPVSGGYQKYEQWLNEVNRSGTQWQNIYRECVIASPNWMARRAELEEIKAFEDLQYPEDYHLTLKWYQSGFKVKTLPEVMLLWREHSARTSRTSDHYTQKAFFELKIKHFIEMDLHTPHLVVWGKNPKGKLTTEILSRHGIPFIWHDLKSYRKIENLENPQIIVAVYPNPKERGQIEKYLTNLGLMPGKNWWYV